VIQIESIDVAGASHQILTPDITEQQQQPPDTHSNRSVLSSKRGASLEHMTQDPTVLPALELVIDDFSAT